MKYNQNCLLKRLFFLSIILLSLMANAQTSSNQLNENIASVDISSEANFIKRSFKSNHFTSEILKQRLAALSEATPFNVTYNATVERYIRLYIKTKKDFFGSLMDKARFYFPIFEEHLDRFDIPLELKYLAVVESALIPNAKSRAGATGLWQFMYHTGKEYGLKINSYTDERIDPIKATIAACQYLKDLYAQFDDWDLALAAYNSGPGNVRKAIRRAGGKRNYWNIRQFLPNETKGYVPAFYTTLYLFEYGAAHEIYPKNEQLPYRDVDTIRVKEKTSFNYISKMLSIEKEMLIQLNPQYKISVIPRQHVLTLPKALIVDFLATPIESENQELLIDQIVPGHYNSYIVQEFDNLSRIAKKHNITIEQLKKWNGLQTNYLIEHQRLVVTDQRVVSPLIGANSDIITMDNPSPFLSSPPILD